MTVESPVTKALMASVTAIVTVWLVVILAWTEAPFAITFDDAFYYVGIARNIAEGNGSTFDGINPTNGYHPLWMLVCVGAFLVGLDGMAAVRTLLAVQVLAYGAALVAIVQIVARFTDGWPKGRARRPASLKAGALLLAATFALVAGNPFVVKTFVNGLETGISGVILALLLWWGVRADGQWLSGLTVRQRLGVSGLLSLAFLARTDAAFLLACISAGVAVEWMRMRPRPNRQVAELLTLPGVTAVVYLASNSRIYGGALQVSGLVKRAEPTVGNVGAFLGFVAVAALVQRLGILRLHATTLTAGITARPATIRSSPARFARTGQFVHRTSWFASFCILLVGYYLTLQTQIWLWYFCPVVLYLLALLPLATADFAEEAFRTAKKQVRANRALLPVWVMLAVPLLIAFLITGRQFADPNLRSIQIANADAGAWIDANLPPDAVLAAWDAGALGFFSRRSVINLDGVVNSRAYYDASRQGPKALRSFLSCRSVRYIANHGGNESGEDPGIREFISELYGPDAGRDARLVHTQPFVYSGITTGSAGTADGLRELAVHVYEIPADAARPVGPCP